MDSTIHYVVGRDGEVFTTAGAARRGLAVQHLQWTTACRRRRSTRPTKETLRAALNPAQGSWLYFTLVNLDTGETAFATTADEHPANVKKLQAWCAAHDGRC